MRTPILTSEQLYQAMQAVDLLYGSLYGKTATFQPFLDCIHDMFADGPCAILTENRDRAVVNLYYSGGDPAGIRSYESYYAGINPWFQPRTLAPEFLRGEVIASEQTLPFEEYRETEFYNDWGLANHVVHGMGTLVHSSPDVMTSILVNRSAGKGEVRPEEIALLQALVPHLGRAVRLQQHLREMDGLRAFFDHSPWPAFVVTPRLRLLLANAAGERLLRRRDGFCARAGYLRTAAEAAEGELRRVVANCGAIGPGDESAWSCRVPRPGAGAGAWHAVFAHPLPAEAAGPGLGSRILLYAVDPMEARPLSGATLGALFRLSAAESALVLALWRHLSLVESAERLGISINTAKTQLQSVFAKTGCSSQTELLVLLARLGSAESR